METRKSAVVLAALLGLLAAAPAESSAQSLRYDVKVERRYLLGEKIPVVLSLTNIGAGRLKVKDIRMSKISMRLKGPINDERDEVRKYTYDGRRGVPRPPPAQPAGDGDVILWYAPTFEVKPDVFLFTGQSTSKKFEDILDAFFIEKGVAPGSYTLTVSFDDRHEVTRKFRVEVDGERTRRRLLQMLATRDETTMNWASYYMFKIDAAWAAAAIRPMLQSERESDRNWASNALHMRGYIKN